MQRQHAILYLACAAALGAALPAGAKDVLLVNRIGPTKSTLYVANADGSGEHKLLATSGFDYNARFSDDGQWIVFTSEREGRGQSDIYRVKADGSALERLTDDPAVDDQASLSPDNRYVAFMSDRGSHRANIWVLDLQTRKLRNLTGAAPIQGDPMKPDGFYRPSWSPDGQWIAFTSDRNTEWKAHDKGVAWEHLQELAVYIVRPDGTGLKRLSAEGLTTGSPKWSADGKQLIAYQADVEVSWLSRVDQLSMKATSQIVAIDVASGQARELTSGPGVKLYPQFLPDGRFAYSTKSAQVSGIMYSDGPRPFPANLREPSWTRDGRQLVYRSWAKGDEGLRIMDLQTRQVRVLTTDWDNVPGWSPTQDLIVFTRKQKDGNFDIFTIRPDGSGLKRVTNHPSSDAHAIWSWDGSKIIWAASEYGFKDEAALYDNSFQPYGQVWAMNPDGSGKEMLTNSRWEDSMAAFAPTAQRPSSLRAAK